MGKVVHLPDDAHEAAKAYCKQNGLSVKDWVSGLILEGVQKIIPITRATKPEPVEKKPTPEPVEEKRAPGIYEQPPFWSGRK